ncbi:hypothetical protein Tco_0304009 [Tanacetum coccineum]
MAVIEVPTATTEGLSETRNNELKVFTMHRERRKHKKHRLVYIFVGNDEVNKERVKTVARFWRTTTADGGFLLKKLTSMSNNRENITKGAIRLMNNSPAKELGHNQGDIIRHVYTSKVDLEDGVFKIAKGSNKIEATKQFQKKKAELI